MFPVWVIYSLCGNECLVEQKVISASIKHRGGGVQTLCFIIIFAIVSSLLPIIPLCLKDTQHDTLLLFLPLKEVSLSC